MTIAWLFDRNSTIEATPTIRGQCIELTEQCLFLRDSYREFTLMMGRMHAGCMLVTLIASFFQVAGFFSESLDWFEVLVLSSLFIIPAIFMLIAMREIILLRQHSDVYFLRESKKVMYQHGQQLTTFHWDNVVCGVFRHMVITGSAPFSIEALILGHRGPDGTICQVSTPWIEGNQRNPNNQQMAEVWEYIRQYMEHGTEGLPSPREPSWWKIPSYQNYLTPGEAWRHYTPWRNGALGERQGKKNWMLPFWALFLPINLACAFQWYCMCRLFRVPKTPAIPKEVLELCTLSPSPPTAGRAALGTLSGGEG